MPNKTIYIRTIKDFEKSVGFSLIDEEVAKKLQEAWKKDNTQAKLDYLVAYRGVFRDVLKKWSDNELSIAFSNRSETMPNFKNCLLKTDETLKVCAMSLIPELRENEDVLSHMTFGVIDSTKLKDEFIEARKKYLRTNASESEMKKRKTEAYNKYKAGWLKTNTRKITELVRDKDALKAMSQEEKIDYAWALDMYRNDKDIKTLDTHQKDLIDDALRDWKQEIGFTHEETFDEFVANRYFQYAQTLGQNQWLENQVSEAIAEYNKNPNPAKQDVEKYKEAERELENAKLAQKVKEKTNPTAGVTDTTAEMVGDFFMQEELSQEIPEAPLHKERVFFQDKVSNFNKEYALTINKDKLYTSIEQLSVLMIKAQEEKQRFLSKDVVVVVEKGRETCYDAKEYYKELILEANKTYLDKVKKIEEERSRVEQEHKQALEKLEQHVADKEALEQLKADREKEFKEKTDGFNKELKEAKDHLQEELSTTQGGVVIEKDGDTVRQYKTSRYYETHETQKEQYAYGEYQQLFSRVYTDACKNVKEKNYPKGLVSDFSLIAKDVDNLFKSAMYLSNMYDDEKNMEIVQKCSFGGLSAEKLASFASNIEGDSWKQPQTSDKVWAKQSLNARKILGQWEKAKTTSKVHPCDTINDTLNKHLNAFNKSEIIKKEMLDNVLAADSFLQTHYSSRSARFFDFIKYGRVKKTLIECRKALGLTEHDSLRVAMNNEYTRLANYMSKEQIFKSVENSMDRTLGFKDEKTALAQEHQIVQDRELARKMSELENLKAKDREPISIPSLDERRIILNQEPRVKPIVPVMQVEKNLSANK